MPGPADFAHGHGLAARTRVNRAGKTACVPARAITTSPDSSGWRSASRTSRWNSGASSRKRIPWWARLAAPGRMHAAAAADDRGHGRGVVRCAERRDGHQPGAWCQAPGDGVDRGDLDRRRHLQGGRIVGSRSASIVLPAPGGPEQGQVVPARRADLHRQPRLRLAEHLRQVQLLGHGERGHRPRRRLRNGGRRRRRAAAQPDDHLE